MWRIRNSETNSDGISRKFFDFDSQDAKPGPHACILRLQTVAVKTPIPQKHPYRWLQF
jgi:hypothetical protein